MTKLHRYYFFSVISQMSQIVGWPLIIGIGCPVKVCNLIGYWKVNWLGRGHSVCWRQGSWDVWVHILLIPEEGNLSPCDWKLFPCNYTQSKLNKFVIIGLQTFTVGYVILWLSTLISSLNLPNNQVCKSILKSKIMKIYSC